MKTNIQLKTSKGKIINKSDDKMVSATLMAQNGEELANCAIVYHEATNEYLISFQALKLMRREDLNGVIRLIK